jgi:hypothetical protein
MDGGTVMSDARALMIALNTRQMGLHRLTVVRSFKGEMGRFSA